MATLLGNSTNPSGVSDNAGGGFPVASQFTCTTSGTVDTIQYFNTTIADTGITGVWLGIFTDSSNQPGTLLGQAQFSGRPAANTWITATGLSVSVTASTVYWLGFDAVGTGAINFNDGSTTRMAFTAAGGHADLSGAMTWTVNAASGPLGVYATGTPAAGVDLNVVLIN